MKLNFPSSFTSLRFQIAAGLTITLLSLILFSGPITDIDFWWHINSGRWIWTNHALPLTDPFLIYPTVNQWARTILQGQWGGQLALFLTYDSFGSAGVIFLRIAVLSAALILFAYRLAQTAAHRLLQLIGIAAVGVVLSGFSAERPQLFSILFFSLLVVILDLAAKRREWQWATLPILVIWTNFHQGVLLGAVVSAIQLSIFAWNDYRTGNRRAACGRLVAGILALISPLATPNGTNGIEYLIWLEFLPAKQRISEYASSISYWPLVLKAPHLLVFFTYSAALSLVLLKSLRTSPVQCVLPALLLLLGILGYRYIPFALIGGFPFLLTNLPRFVQSPILQRVGTIAFSALIGVATFQMLLLRVPTMLNIGISTETMPVSLTEKAKALGISGNVFSTVSWGGFLSWKLEKQGHPFIDGRYLMNIERLEDYTQILWATAYGQQLFSNAQFDWVLMPHQNAFSAIRTPYPLIQFLRNHPEWQLQMETAEGVLFSRKNFSREIGNQSTN